jgi:hypothetical protein
MKTSKFIKYLYNYLYIYMYFYIYNRHRRMLTEKPPSAPETVVITQRELNRIKQNSSIKSQLQVYVFMYMFMYLCIYIYVCLIVYFHIYN